tara:strand:- start:913 stop:3804 length:2892 start_codon:yes stop_codon:yes gene_type:complete
MATETINTETGPIDIPVYARESTLKKMLSAIENLEGASKKQKKAMEDLAKENAKGNKEQDKDNDSLIKAIKDIGDDEGRTFDVKSTNNSLGLFKTALSVVGGTISIFATAVSAAIYSLKGMGDDLTDVRGGTSLDLQTGGAMDNAQNFRNSLQLLGYNADEISARLEQASNVIASSSRETFFSLTKEIQNLTGAGSDFGLTLQQMGDALDADLELRQQIGILNMLDGNKQAKRTADLYKQQLKQTAILGKSIDEISGSSDDTLTTNASVQLLLQSMGEGSQGFVTSIQSMAGDLSSIGLSQGVNNAIQNAMLESVAFRTDAGGDLFEALSVLDANAGTDLRKRIQQINELSKTNPEEAQKLMAGFQSELINGVKGLGPEQLKAMRPVIENFGELGKQLNLSIGQILQADTNKLANSFNALAKGAATYDNALSKFSNGISGASKSVISAFGTPLAGVMDAFTETTYELDENNKVIMENGKAVIKSKGIFHTINEVADKVAKQFAKMFTTVDGVDGKFVKFTQTLKDKINPLIEGMGDKLMTWVASWEADDVDGFIDNMVTAFTVVTGLASALGNALSWVASMVIGTTEEDGEEVFSLGKTIAKAMAFAFGLSVIKNVVGGLFKNGMSNAVSFLGNKIPGLGGGQGKTAAKMGAGFGAGAVGMAAFGVAAAGVGVAILGISTAIEKLGNMEFGDMMQGMFGVAIIGGLLVAAVAFPAVGAAIGAFGIAALPAIPIILSVAAAIAAVGIAAAGIGLAAGGISMLVDSFSNTADEDAMLLDNQRKNIELLAEIDSGKLESTAKGIDAMAGSMVAFGNATNDGWFSGPDLSDQYKQLDIFEKFASLNGDGLLAFTDGMNQLILSINELNAIDTAELLASADALKKLNNATNKGFMENLGNSIGAVRDKMFGGGDSPQINTNSASPTASAEAQANASATGPESVKGVLDKIATNTKNANSKLADLIERV